MMAERQSLPSSLLPMRSFPRFKRDRWEDFQDIVTPEHAYRLVWRGIGPSADRETVSAGSAQEREFAENAGNAHGYCAGKADFAMAGETVLWAYPNDIGPLAVGHVLLDLYPSPRCLSRKVCLTVEKTAVNSSGKHGKHLGEKTDEGQARDLEDYPARSLPEQAANDFEEDFRFIVTVGEDLDRPLPSPPDSWQARNVLTAMDAFIEAEGLWDSTGCFHRAGVYDMAQGKLLKRAEDIGRHNCVDRLAGWSVLEEVPLSDKVLLISARMTSSLCAKAIRAGFPVIVSRSAVTTAAILMAQEANVTLLGFARTQEQRFTVFNQGRCAIRHEEK